MDRVCACGCGKPLPHEMRANAVYLNDSHGRQHRRERQERAERRGTPESFWARHRRIRRRPRLRTA